ncbi:MAG: TolC family protein [Megasphaera sp.]|jgi:TolC family type I secretion outer membrane protein|nr:TolC family protein [Megasphaera sp.]MCH4187110.1 TolC family protein [Megasphaera sp.]MCH4216954.1 TolC family protein [Megasphaera sp.]
MNKKLSRKMIIAMMVTTISAVATASAASTTAVVPVDLSQAEASAQTSVQKGAKAAAKETSKKNASKTTAGQKISPYDIRGVDIEPELREELADKIVSDQQKLAEKHAKDNVSDPVIVVGRVSPGQEVDLTLPKTVQMALDYNRDIKIAKYDLKTAEYSIDEARAGKMPTVSYGWEGARSHSSAKSGSSTGNSYGNKVALNIPLYTGGKVEGNIAVAKLGKTSAQEEILRQQQSVKYSAVSGYFGLLAYQEYRDVYHESVSNLQGHLDNVSAQYAVGTVAKLDVLTSNVSLANAKTTAVTADNNVDNAEANLNNILGLPLQTKLVLSDHKLPFDSYDISLEEAMDYAMKYRPEVLQAAVAVQKAEENVGIAKAGNRPTVQVGASNGWTDTGYILGSESKSWGITGTVSYSLWDGGTTNAKIKQAKENLLAARETEQQTRESVQLAVKQAYLDIRSAAQRVEATQTSIDEAEESFKIARVRYQAGVGINLDVLDAQLSLNEAQTNHIQALYDYNVGIAKLEQVMGVDVRSGVIHPSMTASTYRG